MIPRQRVGSSQAHLCFGCGVETSIPVVVYSPHGAFGIDVAGIRRPVGAGGLRAMTRILVVDDSPTMRRIIATNLKSAGFDGIDEAEDGRVALIKMLRSTVDLLIVDWAMPEMTGLELLRALRSAPSLRDLPVLMITGVGAEEDIREALEAGVNDYIIKPFDADPLAEKVNDLVAPRPADPGGRPCRARR